MDIHKNSFEPTPSQRKVLLGVALLALVGPNGLYLYYAATQPELNAEALRNPVSLAFMIEAMLLLGLFLWYVFKTTGSWGKVWLYLALSFLGSLAFSFPLFLSRRGRRR
ncbi:hypothetical protein [Pelagicoccus sp. SDUM812005]|uniref:hypothetical protein n=1 Tax=Pelagicoccus sp. SDUM812005 TaxID=3041257 RepID=UPI00280DEE8B|nr:hypothetical protein [Pelagicoccus sp. SDUM812005]MDQ8182642.1 hypothetical protein [Pelagicoccus sp. SDUM812005]